MMRRMIILLVLCFSVVNVNAATETKKCIVKSNIKLDSNYKMIQAYANDASIGTPKNRTSYSSIECQRYLDLETPGDPKNIASNPEYIHSGMGFSYGPITVQEVYSCVGTIKYAKIACEYNKSEDSAIKKALKKELEAYINWTNTKMDSYIQSIANSTSTSVVPIVKIDMTETGMSDDVKNRMKVNEDTTFETNGYTKEVIKNFCTKEKPCLVSKSKIYKDITGSEDKRAEVQIWQRKYTVERKYYPIGKQIILDGEREGEVLSINTSCPTGYKCRALTGNKVYTDFLMSAGVHSFKVTAAKDDKTVESSCGYVIYNNGVSGWYDFLNYRQVDPANPFPNGVNEMWMNKLGLFGKEFKNKPLTVFWLDATLISSVRSYNKNVGSYKSVKSPNSSYSSDFLYQYRNAYKKG